MEEGRRITAWAESTPPQHTHYNIRFFLKRDVKKTVLRLRKDSDILRTGYGVIRDRYVYTVYFKERRISACKVKNILEAVDAVKHFKRLSRPERREWNKKKKEGEKDKSVARTRGRSKGYYVDNITCKGKFAVDIRLPEIAAELQKRTSPGKAIVRYRPGRYQAVHIHFPKCQEGGGAGLITLYSTGSYSVVGVRSLDRAEEIFKQAREMLTEIHISRGKIML